MTGLCYLGGTHIFSFGKISEMKNLNPFFLISSIFLASDNLGEREREAGLSNCEDTGSRISFFESQQACLEPARFSQLQAGTFWS